MGGSQRGSVSLRPDGTITRDHEKKRVRQWNFTENSTAEEQMFQTHSKLTSTVYNGLEMRC